MRIRFNNKKIRIGAIIAVVAACGSGFLLSPSVHAAGTERYVAASGGLDSSDCSNSGSPCATISYAVTQAVAGDTISVAAGTYNEAVSITKQLTLKGAQAGTDARTRSGSGETIVQIPSGQGYALNVQAEGVTIDGFTIDGNGEDAGGINFAGASVQSVQVINNIIKNNRSGINILYVDVSGLTVSQNSFIANNVTGQSNGLYIANSTGTNMTISDNSFKDTDLGVGTSVGAAINVYSSGSPAYAYENLRITGNSSDNDYGFISLDSAKNVTISNNTATNERKAAVTIDRNVDTLTLSDNTLKDSPVGVKLRGDVPTGGAAAINVTMTGNTITGMTDTGIQILANSIGNNIVMTQNTITGNHIGLDNQSAVTVDANGNYWGCDAGPGNAGCDSVSGSVALATWVGQTIPGVPNTGFAPNLPILLAVSAGATVLAASGYLTYRAHRR